MRTPLLILAAFVFAVAFAPAAWADAPAAAAVDTTHSAAELHAICAQALNADPAFAQAIVKTINEDTAFQHMRAADDIAKNEHLVILAYAAMWIVSAGFVLFLWRRQQLLRAEIDRLRRDLDAATKAGA